VRSSIAFYHIHTTRKPCISLLTDRTVRHKITPLIEQWQRICILAERIIKRREAAAVWIPSGLRRNYLALPLFSYSSSSPSVTLTRPVAPDFSSASSIFSASTIGLNFEPRDEQADLSRLTNVLNVVVEVNERCWRGDDCELCDGVRHGVEQVAQHTQTHSDLLEQRVTYCS
jgi:sorting nexin-8